MLYLFQCGYTGRTGAGHDKQRADDARGSGRAGEEPAHVPEGQGHGDKETA